MSLWHINRFIGSEVMCEFVEEGAGSWFWLWAEWGGCLGVPEGYCAFTTLNRNQIVDCWVTRSPQTWPLSVGTVLHNRGRWPSLFSPHSRRQPSQQLFVLCFMVNQLCALKYLKLQIQWTEISVVCTFSVLNNKKTKMLHTRYRFIFFGLGPLWVFLRTWLRRSHSFFYHLWKDSCFYVLSRTGRNPHPWGCFIFV